ncbi:putative HTH-type transcriptional regulator [Sphingomonas haloaromaticamans]|uniref:Putative HTH-type transcriptional regulator n=1 Tax=Edaphosphingomonas haloaromaticamans TaxID=653954 RepID=A0A1S1HFS0_9SPHN|nr:putative HTH-type transcriptional regulator [Sphingomonas haloaromaticamans]
MTGTSAQTGEIISFGPFSLTASERLLTKAGVPVELGARALDILIRLASQPNEVVSKRDLLAHVWPDIIVEEGSLRFHIANLRRALGDGVEGARYITTLTGRGYCFVAPVSRTECRGEQSPATVIRLPHANMPNRPIGIVGREDDVAALSRHLSEHRFLTIVGAGGIGKTTVAVEVGHALIDSFAGAVQFVDLGLLSDPALVATAVASMFGLSIQSDDPTPGLIVYLRNKRILLILDTCEHLIDAVAALAARVFAAAPQVHILATSREALEVPGERIHRLVPLACPADDGEPMAIHDFPATRLFIERAAAGGAGLNLGDADAAMVSGICRNLGGVPLAIELAARRVEAYGLRQIAAHLDQSLALSWAGPRSAPPRQKTLLATLEWSYGLLTDMERTVLRRLAIFVGDFTIEAALAVVTSDAVDQAGVFVAVDSLVAKSMVATRPAGAMMRYRLLDTTRAYALGLTDSATERTELAARHAAYYRDWLDQSGAASRILANSAERAGHFAALNNVRAALEWCFSEGGDVRIGIDLAAVAAPVFLAMSLLSECHRWSERALLELDEAARGGRVEMHFQAAIGVAVMFIRGGRDMAREALHRSLAIAEAAGDPFEELQVLGPLQLFYIRTGDFKTALHHARRCAAIAGTLDDPVAMTIARSLLGMALHFGGALEEARGELETALRNAPRAQSTTTVYIGFECRILAGAVLARTLWLQGHRTEAVERARQTVRDAHDLDHAVSSCIALIWATTIFLWAGDFASAGDYVDRLEGLAEANSLTPYLAVTHSFSAQLALLRGDPGGSVDRLHAAIGELRAAPYGMLDTPFNLALVEALAGAGRVAEAHALLGDTMAQVAAKGDACYGPELARVNASITAPRE